MVPIVMYGLRLFIVFYKNYIVYQIGYRLLQCYYCGVFTEKYVNTEFRLAWLLCE